MKKVFALCCFLFFVLSFVHAIEGVPDEEHFIIINQDIEKNVQTDDIEADPLRVGTYTPVKENGTFIGAGDNKAEEDKRTTYDENFLNTLTHIKRILNYILWFLGLIALVYFLYFGVVILTSTEEETHKEALKSIKNAAIAIGGIWLSWFIVTFLYYVIYLVIN